MTMEGGYSAEFLVAWSLYPKRGEHENPKRPAYKAWQARLRQGVSVEDLTRAALGYAAYCKRAKKTDTEMVMMARTFFGPDERWKDFAPKPKGGDAPAVSSTDPPSEENLAQARAFLHNLVSDLAAAKASPAMGKKG